jgi:hypothetical protein
MHGLIGDSIKKRMLAVDIDGSLATVLSLIAAGMVNSFDATAVITALCSISRVTPIRKKENLCSNKNQSLQGHGFFGSFAG